MTIESIEYASPARRHPSLDLFCARLEAMIIGREAEEILNRAEGLPVRAGIVILPVWTWLHPIIDVGRKDREYGTGERMLMPVRNEWTPGHLLLVEESSVELTVRTRGMGHAFAGQSKAVLRLGDDPVATPAESPSLNAPVFVGAMSQRQLIAALTDLIQEGVRARWEIIKELEPRVMQTLRVAHSAVSHEIAQSTGTFQAMLDEIGLEEVLAQMMYGFTDDKGNDKPGSIFRMLELCMTPGCFVRVDPLRYIAKHVRRDGETHIRRRIGDPHIGPKVREIARQFPRADIHEVIAEYRKVYPQDKLSKTRAEAALSVSPDAMARSILLSAETMHVENTEAKGLAELS